MSVSNMGAPNLLLALGPSYVITPQVPHTLRVLAEVESKKCFFRAEFVFKHQATIA